MISLTRLSAETVVLNADLIEYVEATPDTVIALTTGKKIMVKESPQEIIQRVISFKQAVFCPPARGTEV
ncbi:MAG: flagellar FlbD family protein [Candidatus Omnitrophica bacterium]|nr:flagellar FlbD family protein [Candidatus Omnitrophota bacterium]